MEKAIWLLFILADMLRSYNQMKTTRSLISEIPVIGDFRW